METNYLNLLANVRRNGEKQSDRTGIGTLSLFGAKTLEWDMSDGLVPLLTTKTVAWEKALTEILWILRGEYSLEGLGDARNIWEPWADSSGALGGVYGVQLRGRGYWWKGTWYKGTGVDQLEWVAQLLREQPLTRQAVVSMWNPSALASSALPPCPFAFQFRRRRGERWNTLTDAGGTLDLQVFQRSADLFLGVPFDLFEYAVLLRLMARELGCSVGRLIWTGSDCHIYLNHLAAVDAQLSRDPRPLPRLLINEWAPDLLSDELRVSDFSVYGYAPHGRLTGKVAV